MNTSKNIVNKNTSETYNGYCEMLDPSKTFNELILCISLDNYDYIYDLKKHNTVITISDVYNIFNNYTFNSLEDFKNILAKIMKKFDYIIMNPPYKGNLHLQILTEAISFLKDENSKCINLSPYFLRTFELNTIKSIKKPLIQKIINTNFIAAADADKMFNIYSTCDLAITTFGKNKLNIFPNPYEKIDYKIITKLSNRKIASSIRTMIWNTSGDFLVPVQGDYGYAKRWQYTLEQMLSGNPNAKIKFKTQLEADRFKQYTIEKNIYKFIWLCDDKAAIPAHLPFIGNIINPRTNKIGYTSEWTNEDFYTIFNITEDEQLYIEKTIQVL